MRAITAEGDAIVCTRRNMFCLPCLLLCSIHRSPASSLYCSDFGDGIEISNLLVRSLHGFIASIPNLPSAHCLNLHSVLTTHTSVKRYHPTVCTPVVTLGRDPARRLTCPGQVTAIHRSGTAVTFIAPATLLGVLGVLRWEAVQEAPDVTLSGGIPQEVGEGNISRGRGGAGAGGAGGSGGLGGGRRAAACRAGVGVGVSRGHGADSSGKV
jgi:hypothetical protein